MKIPSFAKIRDKFCSLELRECSNGLARDFLNRNHLEGYKQASYLLGLFSGNELIQLLTVGTNSKGEIEISRLATKLNTSVVGGTERLFSHVKTYLKSKEVSVIVSYAYRDITPNPDNSVYKRLGFKFEGFTDPGLKFYVRSKLDLEGTVLNPGIYSRHRFMSYKLPKNWEGSTKDKLFNHRIYRLFDSGNLKFSYQLK